MFMVLAKSVEEMQHIENIVAYICGAAVLVTCAILFAIFAEKRVSAYESRQMIIEENRLQRAQNEVERENRDTNTKDRKNSTNGNKELLTKFSKR